MFVSKTGANGQLRCTGLTRARRSELQACGSALLRIGLSWRVLVTCSARRLRDDPLARHPRRHNLRAVRRRRARVGGTEGEKEGAGLDRAVRQSGSRESGLVCTEGAAVVKHLIVCRIFHALFLVGSVGSTAVLAYVLWEREWSAFTGALVNLALCLWMLRDVADAIEREKLLRADPERPWRRR